ncbi:MAG: tautomerase family protein [Erysipelotrichaceae bacterium]
MPHIQVKMYPGRDEDTKNTLSKALEEAMISVLGCSSDAISISIDEVEKNNWQEVYDNEIMNNSTLYKKPNY